MISVFGFDCSTSRGEFHAGTSGRWKSTEMGPSCTCPVRVTLAHEFAHALTGLLCTQNRLRGSPKARALRIQRESQ